MNIINCPHCNMYVIIEQLNCGIFRCGIYKEGYKQIDPHLPKIECESLILQNKIYGCGNPFQIKNNIVTVCDYI
jgi:hypothetical protein